MVAASEGELKDKYGQDLIKNPPLITTGRFLEKLALRDGVDQHWAKMSLEFASAICNRPALSVRDRYLCLAGEFTVSRNHNYLEDALRSGIGAGVSPRELLEALLLCQVYSGETVLEPALQIFTQVAKELKVYDSLANDQIPIDGPARDLESERAEWPADLESDPRKDKIIEAFGWRGVSTGVHYRGTHHLDSLEHWLNEDLHWGQHWERFCYEGVYSRTIFDDKTRLLCTVADCLALGASAAKQARDHMEESLEFGNSPHELMDLIFMTGVYFGFPGVTAGRQVLEAILKDQNRLHELQEAGGKR